MTWPFENDTSDIEKKLAKRSLHRERQRKMCIRDSICIVPSRYNFEYSSGLSMASAFNAPSDPGVVFKSFSASQQSMRSI